MPIQFLQKHVVRPLRKLYRREVLKDPFLLAVKAWKRDRGDSTLRMDYPLGPGSLVLDVGGYQGDFAADVVSRYGAKVLVFEPMPGFAASSKERFAGEPGGPESGGDDGERGHSELTGRGRAYAKSTPVESMGGTAVDKWGSQSCSRVRLSTRAERCWRR